MVVSHAKDLDINFVQWPMEKSIKENSHLHNSSGQYCFKIFLLLRNVSSESLFSLLTNLMSKMANGLASFGDGNNFYGYSTH